MKNLLTTIFILIYLLSLFTAKPVQSKEKVLKPLELGYSELEKLTTTNLSLYLAQEDFIQDLNIKPLELNFFLDASALVETVNFPTSIKFEIFDTSTKPKRLLSIFRPTIFSLKHAQNFRTNVELLNLTQTRDLEIDVYNAQNQLAASFQASVEIENPSQVSFTELTDANCTGSFGKCQLEYIFQNVHLTTLPNKGLETKVEKNTDGSYTVNLPLFKSKKIKVKNIVNSSDGTDNPSSGNLDFSFDFDGTNLFVIKNGVTTLVNAQGAQGEPGPVGQAGASGPPGAPGAAGPAGSFSGGDATINGVLSFTANAMLENAVLNGSVTIPANAVNNYVLSSDANGLASWVSIGSVVNGAGAFSPSIIKLTAPNSTSVPLTVKGASGQTANITETQTINGTILHSVSPEIHVFNKSSGAVETSIASFKYLGSQVAKIVYDGTIFGSSYSTNAYGTYSVGGVIELEAANSNEGHIDSYNAILIRPGAIPGGSGTRSVTVQGQVSGQKVLIVQGTAGQTANLQEWQNSAGTALSLIDASGNIGAGIASPARKLHISQAMRLEPLSGSQPASASMGDLYMDGDTGTLCLYDGSVWAAVAGGTSTCN